jgi:adenylate kinase family enzyme
MLLRRLAGRGRPDDDPDTVLARLNAGETENEPLVGYYRARGALAEIDAGGPIATEIRSPNGSSSANSSGQATRCTNIDQQIRRCPH